MLSICKRLVRYFVFNFSTNYSPNRPHKSLRVKVNWWNQFAVSDITHHHPTSKSSQLRVSCKCEWRNTRPPERWGIHPGLRQLGAVCKVFQNLLVHLGEESRLGLFLEGRNCLWWTRDPVRYLTWWLCDISNCGEINLNLHHPKKARRYIVLHDCRSWGFPNIVWHSSFAVHTISAESKILTRLARHFDVQKKVQARRSFKTLALSSENFPAVWWFPMTRSKTSQRSSSMMGMNRRWCAIAGTYYPHKVTKIRKSFFQLVPASSLESFRWLNRWLISVFFSYHFPGFSAPSWLFRNILHPTPARMRADDWLRLTCNLRHSRSNAITPFWIVANFA